MVATASVCPLEGVGSRPEPRPFPCTEKLGRRLGPGAAGWSAMPPAGSPVKTAVIAAGSHSRVSWDGQSVLKTLPWEILTQSNNFPIHSFRSFLFLAFSSLVSLWSHRWGSRVCIYCFTSKRTSHFRKKTPQRESGPEVVSSNTEDSFKLPSLLVKETH